MFGNMVKVSQTEWHPLLNQILGSHLANFKTVYSAFKWLTFEAILHSHIHPPNTDGEDLRKEKTR